MNTIAALIGASFLYLSAYSAYIAVKEKEPLYAAFAVVAFGIFLVMLIKGSP